MSGNLLSGSESLRLSLMERVNEACDRFERAWKAGQEPRIEEYLANFDEADRLELLRQLLPLEIELRTDGGDQPTSSEYERRFPECVELIKGVFAEYQIQEDKPLPVPDRIGRYKVCRKLGGGTFGDVYLADDGLM